MALRWGLEHLKITQIFGKKTTYDDKVNIPPPIPFRNCIVTFCSGPSEKQPGCLKWSTESIESTSDLALRSWWLYRLLWGEFDFAKFEGNYKCDQWGEKFQIRKNPQKWIVTPIFYWRIVFYAYDSTRIRSNNNKKKIFHTGESLTRFYPFPYLLLRLG